MGLLFKSTKTKTKTKPKRENNQFLKLVHPGGFVELHAKPIMACEVMKRNPRHYVTRHDFFQFPWIVVSPESILTPGNVFLIVPCHTVRHLSKSTYTTNTNHTTTQISNSNKIRCFPQRPSNSCVKLREDRKHTKVGYMPRSFTEKPLYYSRDYTTSRDTSSRFTHSEQIHKLKPCLKKDKTHNARSRRNLKVQFKLDGYDVNSANFTQQKNYSDYY